MKDIGLQCLYIVVSTVTPIIAGFVAALIKQKINAITSEMKNKKMGQYIETAVGVLTDAVLEVEQTYVDELKKEGAFTPEAQEAAKNQALAIAKRLITKEGKDAIITVYGDFEAFALTKIEALVKQGKKESTV